MTKPPKAEITPEMIDAGIAALTWLDPDDEDHAAEIVERVYRAMIAERPKRDPTAI